MAIDFKRLMSEDARKRHAEADEYYAKDLIKFRNMADENLVASAKYYMTQMKEPWKHEFARPSYDAVFWHVVVPEILRRLEKEE